MEKVDVLIIGAGITGLAVADALADGKKSIFILEKEDKYGTGTSSRNSEVIHAGIYYEPGSLKARLCVEGRRMLYALSQSGAFPALKRGKLIFARSDEEEVELERLMKTAYKNGVENLKLLTAREVRNKEPNATNITAALYSPETGVTNAHALMDYFYRQAMSKGADLVCGITILSIESSSAGFSIEIQDTTGERMALHTPVIVNAAGLNSDEIAEMIGIDIDQSNYRLHYCKGDYFHVTGSAKTALTHLMYPVPSAKFAGLGIHSTIDIAGELRLGPDVTYINREDESYTVLEEKKELFYNSVKDIMPFISFNDLTPDFAGVRPKLQKQGGPIRDFVIAEETEKGFPGLVNCIGIESPGLTASPAIARYVKELL